jgi:pimeloyl-ACP methyl ester carboxylesterase
MGRMRFRGEKGSSLMHWTGRAGVRRILLPGAMFLVAVSLLHAQSSVSRILDRDTTLNNLIDPPGYETARLGTLGEIIRKGTGKQAIILIPGLGFGGSVFNSFMDSLADDYVMYAVSLPGFGGTAAPPAPPEKTSLGEQTWTNGAIQAIEKLMEDERIQRPIIVGHWLTGTQIALRLALMHPDKIRGVVILAGAARLMATDSARAAMINTLEKRIAVNDNFMAPKWFKTVTRETWDDNNFLPGDYAVNPVIGLRLWREAAAPKLHVWVRYLCEFNAQDISLDMPRIAVPTLILKPGLEGLYHDPINNYMDNYCHKSWEGSVENNPLITLKTIPNARVCLWVDQPAEVKRAVVGFLKTLR